MLKRKTPSRLARPLWLLLIMGAMLLVAACAPGGPPTGTTNTAAQPSPTAASTPAKTPATTTKTGCPAATQDVNWPTPPGAVFTTQQAKMVNVKVGETFEITVPMGHTWKLLPMADSILKLDTPSGYGDADLNSCVWHFTTLASGKITLEFSMQAVCEEGKQCPNYITVVDFTVNASA